MYRGGNQGQSRTMQTGTQRHNVHENNGRRLRGTDANGSTTSSTGKHTVLEPKLTQQKLHEHNGGDMGMLATARGQQHGSHRRIPALLCTRNPSTRESRHPNLTQNGTTNTGVDNHIADQRHHESAGMRLPQRREASGDTEYGTPTADQMRKGDKSKRNSEGRSGADPHMAGDVDEDQDHGEEDRACERHGGQGGTQKTRHIGRAYQRTDKDYRSLYNTDSEQTRSMGKPQHERR